MIVYKDFLLADILWYRVGGKARYLLEVESEEDVQIALDFVQKNNIGKLFICGLGSNLIFPDDYFDGAVIRIARTKRAGAQISLDSDGFFTSFAGDILDDLLQFSFDNGFVGLHWAGGLPGTVGAGIRGNVGAFGGELKDSFVSAKILEYTEREIIIKTVEKENFHFSYRHSLIKEQKNFIILSGRFRLNSGSHLEVEQAREVYMANIQYRKDHHPLEYPSCGSVFKNISDKEQVDKILEKWPDIRESIERKWHGKVSMGYIIHRLGFAGYTIGKMKVSEKHSNFIINLGGAKASDVKEIIREIQDKVFENFGFRPEVEVEIIG